VRSDPRAEVAYSRATAVGGGLFDVVGLYGRDYVWSFSLGVRVSAGMSMHRMGRYGAATDEEGPMVMPGGMMP
jgi:hypothetical protein